jgi:hypothetical protein
LKSEGEKHIKLKQSVLEKFDIFNTADLEFELTVDDEGNKKMRLKADQDGFGNKSKRKNSKTVSKEPLDFVCTRSNRRHV